MTQGSIALKLVSDQWGTGRDAAAVAEVAAVPGKGPRRPSLTIPLAVGALPQQVALDAGDYLVRLYLPSGDVEAERVRVEAGQDKDVTFEVRSSPHEWLAAATNLGVVQRLPRLGDAGLLKAALEQSTTPARGAFEMRAGLAVDSMERATGELQRITGVERVEQARGWRWVHRVDPDRAWPGDARLARADFVRWWTGEPVGAPVALAPDALRHDSHNVVFVQRGAGQVPIDQPARAFAAVQDPMGGRLFCVFPEDWRCTSRSRLGQRAETSVLLTVVVDSTMGEGDNRSQPVRWRCSPQIDDVEAMSLLGFLHAERSRAGRALLQDAHAWLFAKYENPVAAAAGAYTLLAFMDEATRSLDPGWRDWVRNLHHGFPWVPDGAIAMAQMAFLHGEDDAGREPDVERIRAYALEAVRRGLPFLTWGIRVLTEVLVALAGDDRAGERQGPQVERTREALALVRQLGRIVQPGEFFTVLRLDEGAA